jgi:hypothetical protein
VIKEKFNIEQTPDGRWRGGQPAKEIFKTMRIEFGHYDSDQIYFITQLVTMLNGVAENQGMNDRYALIINRLNPSLN